MNRISPWAILFTYFHKFVRITLITLRALRNKTERQCTHTYTHLHCDYYWKQWEILFELIHLFHYKQCGPIMKVRARVYVAKSNQPQVVRTMTVPWLIALITFRSVCLADIHSCTNWVSVFEPANIDSFSLRFDSYKTNKNDLKIYKHYFTWIEITSLLKNILTFYWNHRLFILYK